MRGQVRLFSRALIVLSTVGLLAAPGIAGAQPEPEPAPNPQVPSVAAAPQAQQLDLPDVPDRTPPNGAVSVDRGPSKALDPIPVLPGLDPAPGEVSVEKAPLTPNPPVAPGPLDLPRRPGQELVDATAADALATLGRAERLTPEGTPDLDAVDLQPQVAKPQFIDPARPVGLRELIDALASGDIPPPLPVDPLALLEQLPGGLPRITYRVCSESATKPVSCSLTLPLGVPAIVDVTGDRTPDVLVDLLPAAALGDVVGGAKAVLDLEKEIAAAENRLSAILKILQDPIQAILHPELLVEATNLRGLLRTLRGTLEDKVNALFTIVHLGLAELQLRLPTSEYAGRDLPGHVWAVYDIPGSKRLSLGFDGYRRGTSLPTGTLGLFTFNPVGLLQGIYDIKATLLTGGAGSALAITAGVSSVADTDKGEAYDPTVASVRFSPVPALYTAHARIDPGSADRDQRSKVDSTSDKATHLDAIVLSNTRTGEAPSDRFTQLKVDSLPKSVSLELTRPSTDATAKLDYTADSGISDVLFADFDYARGSDLQHAVQATAKDLPTAFNAALTTADPKVTLDYTATSRVTALDAAVLDKPGGIVGRGALRGLPTKVELLADRGAGHVRFAGDGVLTSATVALSRNLSDYAPMDGDHANLITNGDKLGVSARISGLRSVEAYYDSHPRLTTAFEPGGQALFAGGDLDGLHKAQMSISNLPATASLDADTATRDIAYRASSVIDRVNVAYLNTRTGPTLVAGVTGLPTSVDVNYELGDKPQLKYAASSRVPTLDFFASPSPVATLRPTEDHYLSAAGAGIPSTMDVLVDLPARHLESTLSEPMDSIAAVARFPMQGRDWTAMGELTGLPTKVDADFREGGYRFRGVTGPLGSAKLAITNHGGATAPTGLHVGAHYRQTSGEMDASASVRNLSHVEYSTADGQQNIQLNLDSGGAPVFIDADVILAANNVDDTQLSVLGRVDGLPSTVNVTFAGKKLVYSASKQIGLALNVKAGKLAAMRDLRAPLFDNGVAAVAKTCGPGAGCAVDEGPFCEEGSCLGLVGTVNLPGLPTNVTVDLAARTVALTGYRPPAAPLQAYVRLIGVIDSLPDFRAAASLSGLPSALDFVVGPLDVGTGASPSVDVRYAGSAPLGTLRVDVDTTTNNAAFPVIRANATVARLPQTFHVNGQFGDRTSLAIRDSAPIDSIAVTVTGADRGYLQATGDGIPATADLVVDLPGQKIIGEMSDRLGGLKGLAHVPYGGRTWSVYAEVRDVPAKFTADFAAGKYKFGSSTPLGLAAIAVTNHAGARAPHGDHLAVHYRETTGDIDASARLTDVSAFEFAHMKSDFTTTFAAAPQKIALDADVVLAAAGADDTKIAALGTLGPIPSKLTISSAGGVVTYLADQTLDLQAQVWLGKVAALNGLGAPRFDNGISMVAGLCQPGAGCTRDDSLACVERGCVGLTGILNVTGLPESVVVDTKQHKYSFARYEPRSPKLELYAADRGAFVPAPLTGAKAMVTLTGLPTSLNLEVGPMVTGESFDIKYGSDVVKAGKLELWAEATGVPTWNTVRIDGVLDQIPGKVHVKGKIGGKTNIEVENSAPIRQLAITATGHYATGAGTGIVSLTDVPARLRLGADGFGQPQGLSAGELRYEALDGLDTLDADVLVESRMIKATAEIDAIDDIQLHLTNLGHKTLIEVLNEPDSTGKIGQKALSVRSEPKTDRITVVAALNIEVPRQDISKTFLECVVITGRFYGHLEVKKSRIDDVTVDLVGVKDIVITPGKIRSDLPFGIAFPEATKYLFQAFSGTFDHADIRLGGVRLDLDIDLWFRIDKVIGPDFFQEHVSVPPATYQSVKFHKYDYEHVTATPFEVRLGPLPIFKIILFTKPGLVEPPTTNAVTIPGNKPSMISFLDPGDRVNDYIFDILAFGTWPFDGEHKPDFSNDGGGC